MAPGKRSHVKKKSRSIGAAREEAVSEIAFMNARFNYPFFFLTEPIYVYFESPHGNETVQVYPGRVDETGRRFWGITVSKNVPDKVANRLESMEGPLRQMLEEVLATFVNPIELMANDRLLDR